MDANLTKRVMVDGDQKYCAVVWSKNNLLKPHIVVVNGKNEEHAEGAYYLEWRENGHRNRISVGNDPVIAANRYKRQLAIQAGVEVTPLPSGESVKLADAITSYLDEVQQQKKPKTHAAYRMA